MRIAVSLVLTVFLLAGCATQAPVMQASTAPAPAPAPVKADNLIKNAGLGAAIAKMYGPDYLPVLTTSKVPQPSGAAGNLTVLDWAGAKAAVTYTFDDSQPSQWKHYKDLMAAGFHLTFYASAGWDTSFPNYDAAWSQAVKDGNEIGNHTYHHPYADLKSPAASGPVFATPLEEIDKDTAYIQQHFGEKHVWTFAAPYGDFAWGKIAKERFFLNRGVVGGNIMPDGRTNIFDMPTMMATGGQKADPFNKAADYARQNDRWQTYLFHSILPGANWYAGTDVSTLTGTMQYVKDAKDIWVDTMANVGAYYVGQRTFMAADLKKSDDGKTLSWTWKLPDHFPPGHYLRVTVSGGTLTQNGKALKWDTHGYYQVALDAGELTLAP